MRLLILAPAVKKRARKAWIFGHDFRFEGRFLHSKGSSF
jgi:hypothetical protein